MAVQVSCPQCGKVASFREVDQGKAVRCGACATVFEVAGAPGQEAQSSNRAQKVLAQQAADEQWVKGLWDVISTPMLILMRFIGKEPQLAAPHSDASPRPGLAAPAHPNTLSTCPVCGSAWPKDSSRCMNCHWDCIQARHIAPAMAPPIPSGLGLQAPVARPPDPHELSACPSCGSPWKRFELQCTVCNWDPVRNRHVAPRRDYASNDGSLDGGEKAAGCLLAFFLGFLGAHRFYLGHHNTGLSQLLIWFVNISIGAYALFFAPEWLIVTWTVGSCLTIWIVVDGIRILTGSIYKTGRSSSPGHHDREGPATSGASIAALVLALVSLFFFPPFVGVAAFACGIIGLVTSRNKALPIIALLLSIVCPIIGFFMGVIVAIIPNALQSASERNEAATIASCRIFAEAQDIYVRTDYDGDGVIEYSQTISGANSLYEMVEGEGDLTLVDAAMAGAEVRANKPAKAPKAGYYFKVLWKQGSGAPGGIQDYIKRGNMVEGYALVAWPAQYGISGQNTFILNKTGTVYARDLGQDTQSQCERMDTFDPTGWQPVE